MMRWKLAFGGDLPAVALEASKVGASSLVGNAFWAS